MAVRYSAWSCTLWDGGREGDRERRGREGGREREGGRGREGEIRGEGKSERERWQRDRQS